MKEQSVYTVRDYGLMIADRRRTEPYVRALERNLRPGDVVLDIGTGAGIFAFLACRLGASKVYAVELDDAIDLAKLSAGDNPGSDRIEWIHGLSTEVELPERVDLIIADLHGVMPFFSGNVASLIDARERFLKPGGRIIPSLDTLWVAPAESEAEYETIASPWSSNAYALDLSAVKTLACNGWWRLAVSAVGPETFLSDPLAWATIDYATALTDAVDRRMEWTARRSGTLHGFYVWFDTEFGEEPAVRNSPLLPSTAYGRAFFPLETPVAVETGDRLAVRMSASSVDGEHVYRWDTDVSSGLGAAKFSFRQNTFKGRPVRVKETRRSDPKSIPSISRAGRIALRVLGLFSESMSIEAISRIVQQEFPEQFSDYRSALRYVGKLSIEYSG